MFIFEIMLPGLILVLQLSFSVFTGELWRGEKGKIFFESDAPLELISARSNELSGIVDPDENTFAFSVSSRSFRGFNSPLQQEHFHENYMESETYPTASFSGRFIEDLTKLQSGKHVLRAKGRLKIHGVSVERIIKCEVEFDDKRLWISSNFVVPLSDHNISVPQVVHQKIAEEILVKVEIELRPK